MLPAQIHFKSRTPRQDPWQFFRGAFENVQDDGGSTPKGNAHYPIDVHEQDTYIAIEAELPGFTKEQVDVSLEDGVLTIAAEREPVKRETGTTHLSQRRHTRVHRRLEVPPTVDPSAVEAELADGVLYIKLHKQEQLRARKIEVQ